MTNIPLHPKRALDPKLIKCPLCHKNTGEIAIGHSFKGQAKDGTWHAWNRGRKSSVVHEFGQMTNVQEIGEREDVYSPVPCDTCRLALEKERREHADMVELNGAIYWSCEACDRFGVIRETASLAQAVRQRHQEIEGENFTEKNKAGRFKPCGLQFKNCEEHTPEGS